MHNNVLKPNMYPQLSFYHLHGDLEQNKTNNINDKITDKNELKYWFISPKEVAKFKPCTETFIRRE